MLKKTSKYEFLYACFSLYFLFFMCWMQFHHGHEAEEYLELGDDIERVEILSTHNHNIEIPFPLIEHHIFVVKPHLDCPLCAVNWLFDGLPVVETLVAADHSYLRISFASKVLSCKSRHNFYLRAPPFC